MTARRRQLNLIEDLPPDSQTACSAGIDHLAVGEDAGPVLTAAARLLQGPLVQQNKRAPDYPRDTIT